MERYHIAIIGHRGSGKGTKLSIGSENTLLSFTHAFDNGAEEVECDLALTKDKIIIIHHDQFIKTQNKKTLPVSELSFSEIKTIAPDVVKFNDLLAKFPENLFTLELKSYTDFKKIIEIMLVEFDKAQFARLKFISFSFEALEFLKQSDPDLYGAYIATCTDERFDPLVTRGQIDRCCDLGLNEIAGHWLGFRPAMIKRTIELGMNAGIGFVNNAYIYKYCLKNQVTRLYTDFVPRLVNLRDQFLQR